MVRIMPSNRVRRVCDAVAGPAIKVCTMRDACEIGDGGDERWLLGSTVHPGKSFGRASSSIERGDRVGSLSSLMRIGRSRTVEI